MCDGGGGVNKSVFKRVRGRIGAGERYTVNDSGAVAVLLPDNNDVFGVLRIFGANLSSTPVTCLWHREIRKLDSGLKPGHLNMNARTYIYL